MSSHPLSSALDAGLQALHLTLPPQAPTQLLAYLDLISRWNKVYNLTAIRDPREMLSQHLLDCLALVGPLDAAAGQRPADAAPWRLLDVGSGAGLPGVVLAICRPTWSVTCVDTVAKKAGFIRQVGAELGLANLNATHQRVEAMTEPPFELITSRAFASLVDFVTLSRARLAPGGQWVAMKAKLQDAEQAEVPADVVIQRVQPLQVPGLAAERCLVWLVPR
ncbi:16S rRNA (guanine(527)-N(7))-methyltransferase RsmG [Ideonella azotifigens]|uniref:Ribosomal RNA small subunit methyltransferase G n=1 Tax=Ideonella azotifigens TaxID=513160 RepID=A0ABN1JPI0_9BURK|nr:16S rRNA (guanine(527)-N(7))-methyltransferase RsmG [Ideonella azotifigens]MCD2340066.1 16S rRNA (guanine(527)-N(7))-methyltransferase RsmG [Ideonella azotifigens]